MEGGVRELADSWSVVPVQEIVLSLLVKDQEMCQFDLIMTF